MDSLNIGVGKRGRCDNSRVKGPIQSKHYVIFASPPDLRYVMHLQQSQRWLPRYAAHLRVHLRGIVRWRTDNMRSVTVAIRKLWSRLMLRTLRVSLISTKKFEASSNLDIFEESKLWRHDWRNHILNNPAVMEIWVTNVRGMVASSLQTSLLKDT